jgi:hypothetical protein
VPGFFAGVAVDRAVALDEVGKVLQPQGPALEGVADVGAVVVAADKNFLFRARPY